MKYFLRFMARATEFELTIARTTSTNRANIERLERELGDWEREIRLQEIRL